MKNINLKSLETLILKSNRFLVFQNKININKDTSVKLPIFFFKGVLKYLRELCTENLDWGSGQH